MRRIAGFLKAQHATAAFTEGVALLAACEVLIRAIALDAQRQIEATIRPETQGARVMATAAGQGDQLTKVIAGERLAG